MSQRSVPESNGHRQDPGPHNNGNGNGTNHHHDADGAAQHDADDLAPGTLAERLRQTAARSRGSATGQTGAPGSKSSGPEVPPLSQPPLRPKMPQVPHPQTVVQKQLGRAGRVGRAFQVRSELELLRGLKNYLAAYIVLPEPPLVVVAAWVMASYLMDCWSRFPHLAVTSPEGRCGKTRLLELLEQVCRQALSVTSISPAGLYRTIEKDRPTLLQDEAQSLARRASETTEVLREIFCGGIGRTSKVVRCVGPNHVPTDFSIYCPKVVALVGSLDGILADRCLPILMKRKTDKDEVKRYREREVSAAGTDLALQLAEWAGLESTRRQVEAIYESLEPFTIRNDRMAELLLPLQTVLTLASQDHNGETDGPFSNAKTVHLARQPLILLRRYAEQLEEQERESERLSPGVRLLAACRDVFAQYNFLSTLTLLSSLHSRQEERWYRFDKGQPLSGEGLAALLEPFDIRPRHDQKRTQRGYWRADFEDAWQRYLPKPTPA
jgi:hypothetical protein